MLRVAFRVDSGLKIGSGHLTRCITLANALKGRGLHSVFICRPQQASLESLVLENGFPVERLPEGSGKPTPRHKMKHPDFLGSSQECDAKATLEVLARYPSITTLVVDHYGIDELWDHNFFHKFKVVKIDDLADRKHQCHVLVDSNYYLEFESRYAGLVPERTIRLLGPEYVPLGSHFRGINKSMREVATRIDTVLLAFGGSDHQGNSFLVAKDLLTETRLNVIVIGRQSATTLDYWQSLKARFGPRLNVTGYTNDPIPYFLKADLYIGAAGTITWERFVCGLPGIVYSLAANQVKLAEDLAAQDLASYLGDIKVYSFSKLHQAIDLVSDQSRRRDISARMQHLVDGEGATRIIEALGL